MSLFDDLCERKESASVVLEDDFFRGRTKVLGSLPLLQEGIQAIVERLSNEERTRMPQEVSKRLVSGL